MTSNKLKSTLFQTLDIFPSKTGFHLYHQLQKFLFKNLDSKIKANKASFKKCEDMLTKHAFSLEHKNILEIGSGWMPMMPYLFKSLGKCSKIYTYDINKHYDNKYINKLNQMFPSLHDYYEQIPAGSKYNLPSFVKYFPKRDVGDVKLPNDVDLVFSRFVLEHVDKEAMIKMHKNLGELNANTLILHMISPSDHRAYTDKSLSLYDFLKYSQDEWDSIQTKFDYHNRMRLPQYLEIFESTGFEVLDVQYDVPEKDSAKYKAFKKLSLHEEFSKYAEEELLAGAINVILRNKKQR